MLRHIPRNITPDLMDVLMRMGHGDEIVFGDANFPAESMGQRVVHAEGDTIENLLASILPFFPLDDYVEENAVLMSVVAGKGEEPAVWNKYRDLLERYDEEKAFTGFSFPSRQELYARARTAVAVVATGEREKYSNIILKLGVVK